MFGKRTDEPPMPKAPTAQDILEDLEAAGPDDVVFTTDIGHLQKGEGDIGVSKSFELKRRLEVRNILIWPI